MLTCIQQTRTEIKVHTKMNENLDSNQLQFKLMDMGYSRDALEYLPYEELLAMYNEKIHDK